MYLPDTYIIILAAGTGSRFGGDVPKQFRLLAGRPVLIHTVERMRRALPGARVLLVLAPSERERWLKQCREYGFESPEIVDGGQSRWESVSNGLGAIGRDAAPGSIVLIHDGARPLTDAVVVRRVATAALNTDGAIPVVEVTDSLRRLDDDGVSSEPVDRADFRAVQTPQGFALWRLREAYTRPYEPWMTDDASVVAAAGFQNVVLVDGSPDNIKVTNPRDLAIAEAIMQNAKP